MVTVPGMLLAGMWPGGIPGGELFFVPPDLVGAVERHGSGHAFFRNALPDKYFLDC